ncbi:MAG TPA: tocopherol cyclase family protein [Blastocatellia bacterium]|nr:tocopherol cyclase family protein [Blastocatellia bacterium]
MTATIKTSSGVALDFSDNLCRWDGHTAGHYEVWFLTLNDCASQRGYWFRYAIESPDASIDGRGPRAALWAAAFDRKSPRNNFGLKREYPIDQFAFESRKEFRLELGDGEFSPCRAVGAVADEKHSIEWDLSFTPCDKTYHHITRKLNMLIRPSTVVCSPNLDTRFSGTIVIDGRKHKLNGEPGCQSHLWGRKRADEWVWLHSNAFEGHAGTVFEGLAARARTVGRTLPPLQSLYLRHRGEEHHFVRLRLAEQWKHKLGVGYWNFSAMNTRVLIKGSAQCRLRDMLQATYIDPDGEPLYCVNSEVANLKLRIFRRVKGVHYRHVETINSRATAHLEHASRITDTEVKMAFINSFE